MNSSILADIEETLSDDTTREISCKYWYWNEFLPKIDEDNIRNDYRLVYQSFTTAEFMFLPYDITDERWNWLIKNQIVVVDNFNYEDASNIEKWIYEGFRATAICKDNIIKYTFSDKFFDDYQRNVRERRKLTAMETWMDYLGNSPHRLYSQDKYLKYGYPRTFMPVL